ncbi:MAG: hypothetical protein AAGB48_13330 [Planctomycetota bacterium]
MAYDDEIREARRRGQETAQMVGTTGKGVFGVVFMMIMTLGRLPEPLCCFRMGRNSMMIHAAAMALVVVMTRYVTLDRDDLSIGHIPYLLFGGLYLLHVAAMLVEAAVQKLRNRRPPIHSWSSGQLWPWWEGLRRLMLAIPLVKRVTPSPLMVALLWFPLGLFVLLFMLHDITGIEGWLVLATTIGGMHLGFRVLQLSAVTKQRQQLRDQQIEAEDMQAAELQM